MKHGLGLVNLLAQGATTTGASISGATADLPYQGSGPVLYREAFVLHVGKEMRVTI